MDIRNIFNILLIGLTLSTVVLTLIVYFVFKLRQGFVRQAFTNPYELEGQFFVRTAPLLAQANEWARAQYDQKQAGKIRLKYRPVLIFSLTFASIVLFLSLENYLSHRKFVHSRASSLAKYDLLKRRGLLQEYSMSEGDKGKADIMGNPHLHRTQGDEVLRALGSRRIDILTQEAGGGRLFKALASWFGDSLKISVRSKAQSLSGGDILILDGSVPNEQRASILQAAGKYLGVILIGGPGRAEALGNSEDSNPWIGNRFGIAEKPSLSKSKQRTVAKIPAGFPIDFPAGFSGASPDTEHAWVLPLQQGPGFDCTNSHGQDLTTCGLFVEGDPSRPQNVLWLGFHPVGSSETDSVFLRNFWAYSLAWLSRVPVPVLAKWPNHERGVASWMVSSEKNYESLDQLQQLFKKKKVAASYFVLTDEYQRYFENFAVPQGNLDIQSMGDRFEDLSRTPEMDTFERIQNSRLILEEMLEKRVEGFRFSFDQFRPIDLQAAAANRFGFIVVRPMGNVPEWWEPVTAGEQVIFSGPKTDDKVFLGKHDILTDADFSRKLKLEIKKAEQHQGHFIFHIHPEILGDPKMRSYLNSAIEAAKNSGVSWLTLSDVASWKRDLEKVQLHYQEGRWSVQNSGTRPVSKLGVYFDKGKSDGFRLTDLGPGETVELTQSDTPTK